MLKLTPKATFKTKVLIPIAGYSTPEEIEVEFKYLDIDGVQKFFGGLNGKTDFENLKEIVVGWGNIEAEFSEKNLESMLKAYPRASMALFGTFSKEVLPSREKN